MELGQQIAIAENENPDIEIPAPVPQEIGAPEVLNWLTTRATREERVDILETAFPQSKCAPLNLICQLVSKNIFLG